MTVGTVLAASASLLPEAVAMLKKERPAVAVTIMDGTYDVLMPALMVGDIDMVLGRLPEAGRQAGLIYEEIHAEPICLAVRRGHPLAERGALSLADLVDQPWVFPVQSCRYAVRSKKCSLTRLCLCPATSSPLCRSWSIGCCCANPTASPSCPIT